MKRRRYAGRDARRAITIEDLRGIAARRLPNFIREYVEGGAEDELSLRRNRDVFGRIAWQPRTLAASGAPDLGTELFGVAQRLPLVIAPTGFNGLLWPRGDLALARAAAEAGIPFTLSTAGNLGVRDIARDAGTAPWFQLYPLRDVAATARLVALAEEAGSPVLVVTTDFPAIGAREWDARNYARPMELSLGSKLDVLAHPRWLWQVMVPRGAPEFASIVELLPAGQRSALLGAKYMSSQLNTMLSWRDIEELRRRWRGRLVLKGILCVEDAKRAAEAGVDGIVLSNHGGRQLDSAVAAVELLPAVVAACGGRLTVLVDGGFRRGSDVLKAIALGADAVMLGRATLYGLAAGGEPGVTHALGLLRGEMLRVMTLLGCTSLAGLGRHLIRS